MQERTIVKETDSATLETTKEGRVFLVFNSRGFTAGAAFGCFGLIQFSKDTYGLEGKLQHTDNPRILEII